MKINIESGTKSDQDKDLCLSCKSVTYIQGHMEKEVIKHCTILGDVVNFLVYNCTDYKNKAAVSLYDMREIAWVLRTDKHQQIGFIRAKDFERETKESVLPDIWEGMR